MHHLIEIWNNIALIRDDAYFTKWVKQEGRLDHHQGFLEYLKPYLGGVMLDIGANIGTHSIYYAQFGDVLCFEPNPLAYECLRHNMRNTTTRLYHLAIGSSPGYVDMSTMVGGNYGAMYTQPGNSIPQVTIDSLLLPACNFIKIDVEGSELDVLEGAAETIRKFKPIMCIESNPETLQRKGHTTNDLVVMLHTMGYITNQRVPADISCDLLCTPI